MQRETSAMEKNMITKQQNQRKGVEKWRNPKDIIDEDKKCLIKDPTIDKVWLAVKQFKSTKP